MDQPIRLILAILLVVPLAHGVAWADDDDDDGGPRGLAHRVMELEQQVAALTAAVAAIESNNVLDLGPYVRVEEDEINDLSGPHVIFEGANVHVRSGAGATAEGCGLVEPPCPTLTGLGNLVVGYNETRSEPSVDRSGSHNLVVGWSCPALVDS